MCERVFEEHGIEDYEFILVGRHPSVVFTTPLGSRRFVLPSTPSDRLGIRNSRADLRRLCRQQEVSPPQ